MAADWTSALNRARDHAPFLARALERRPELAELMASGDGEAALRAAKQVRATDVASALRQERLGLALVLGGALGNIADRVRLGYVVDFADLHFGGWQPFLVFNVADAAITLGVLVLLVRALLMRDKRDIPSENPHA